MILKLLDYGNREVSFEIGELTTIDSICINVLTGDEVARVRYKDGTLRSFDSSGDRIADYEDISYMLYRDGEGGLLCDEKWINRKNSYWYENADIHALDMEMEEAATKNVWNLIAWASKMAQNE